MPVTSLYSKLQGQPESYVKKSKYTFGRHLGAGTYGTVREADSAEGKVAVKIIMKRNVKGNEQMIYDELEMLQSMRHPHIIRFVDWFESKDKYYIVTQLATGGELFERITEVGKFTEKDASRMIKQVLEAVDYLHKRDIVHRDLKPENLLYVTKAEDSPLVLADFGIAKHLDSQNAVLKTVAGSPGYAAPEVMMRQGHGKPVDIWSLGVITYVLLCGYPPFRGSTLPEMIEETQNAKIDFHERYWKGISTEAKELIKIMLKSDPRKRITAAEALKHPWIAGKVATDHDLVPEIKAYLAKARLRRGIEIIKLANRIEALKMQEDDEDGAQSLIDPNSGHPSSLVPGTPPAQKLTGKARLSRAAKSAIFREVVLAKVRELKAEEMRNKVKTGEVKPV